MPFLNRADELRALEDWWRHPRGQIALVWGRRRVGKSALLQRFAAGRRSIFHVFAGRPLASELALLSLAAADTVNAGFRDLRARPFLDLADAIHTLAGGAREPTLLVLDEFPELLAVAPSAANELRALWEQVKASTQLRIALCGSAMRVMEDLQLASRPLYGRLSPKLLLQPFRPHEAALMLERLTPSDRALTWGILGGIPLYLEQWDPEAPVDSNLARLFLRPGASLLTEGDLLLSSEAELGQELAGQVLYAIAGGRTTWSEIKNEVRAKPERALDRLMTLRLVERMVPVTEDPSGHRRAFYRIADPFMRFWLRVIAPHRTHIDRGLGATILPVVMEELDEHMGSAWEDAFRAHLIRLATAGELGRDVVAVGGWWSPDSQTEIDAVVLSGRGRTATLVGEAKWARSVDARRLAVELQRKALRLPAIADELRVAVCARERVAGAPEGTLIVTAADVFDTH